MKSSLVLFLLLLLNCCTSSEEKTIVPDARIRKFMQQENYVALDSPVFKEKMSKAYVDVVAFFLRFGLHQDNYYTQMDKVEKKGDCILVPLRHVKGFQLEIEKIEKYGQWRKEKKNQELDYFPTRFGNKSGMDGTLKVNTTTNTVVDFVKWK